MYTADPDGSRRFWCAVLDRAPTLDVPGMTELPLGQGAVLGLMPEAGIGRLLPGLGPLAAGGARTELYLAVADPAAAHARALAAGARELSPLLHRDWGDDVAYSLSPDGVVLGLAAPSNRCATSSRKPL